MWPFQYLSLNCGGQLAEVGPDRRLDSVATNQRNVSSAGHPSPSRVLVIRNVLQPTVVGLPAAGQILCGNRGKLQTDCKLTAYNSLSSDIIDGALNRSYRMTRVAG